MGLLLEEQRKMPVLTCTSEWRIPTGSVRNMRIISKRIFLWKNLCNIKCTAGENTQVMDYLNKNTSYYSYGYERDSVMRYSDYAALREIAGYPAVHLQPGQYLIHCMDYLEGVLKSYQQPLALGDDVLDWGGVYTEHMIQDDGLGNGVGFVLVVPDELAKDLPFHHWGMLPRRYIRWLRSSFMTYTIFIMKSTIKWICNPILMIRYIQRRPKRPIWQ